jgi:hypothetical protein
LPEAQPERGYFSTFNNDNPYLRSVKNNITLSNILPTAFIERNMTEAFLSEDEVNCPCVSYELEKIVDSEFNQTLSVASAHGYQFSIDNNGIFKYENYTSYHKFFLWLSCKNPAGVDTGVRENPNIWL